MKKKVYIIAISILAGCAHDFVAPGAISNNGKNRAPAQASALPPGSAEHSCTEPSVAALPLGSAEIEYFQKLVNKGPIAPLSDYLHLWYPKREKSADPNSAIEKCIAFITLQDPSSIQIPDCHLDTAYSWGSREKIETLKKTLPDGDDWGGVTPNPGRTLDATASAVGTFGYGLIPVRIRSRKTVFLWGDNLFTDGKEIESWSFGTPEHYDEIVRDRTLGG